MVRIFPAGLFFRKWCDGFGQTNLLCLTSCGPLRAHHRVGRAAACKWPRHDSLLCAIRDPGLRQHSPCHRRQSFLIIDFADGRSGKHPTFPPIPALVVFRPPELRHQRRAIPPRIRNLDGLPSDSKSVPASRVFRGVTPSVETCN